MSAYKVLRGVSYGSNRAEPGDVVSDLPASSVAWLLEARVIEPADEQPKQAKKPKAKSEPVSEAEGDE